MTIKQYIGKAIRGGWGGFQERCPKGTELVFNELAVAYETIGGDPSKNPYTYHVLSWWEAFDIHAIVLDPSFWKALAKVEDWATNGGDIYDGYAWLKKWYGLIDALAEGGTIEEYLETL